MPIILQLYLSVFLWQIQKFCYLVSTSTLLHYISRRSCFWNINDHHRNLNIINERLLFKRDPNITPGSSEISLPNNLHPAALFWGQKIKKFASKGKFHKSTAFLYNLVLFGHFSWRNPPLPVDGHRLSVVWGRKREEAYSSPVLWIHKKYCGILEQIHVFNWTNQILSPLHMWTVDKHCSFQYLIFYLDLFLILILILILFVKLKNNLNK